MEIIKVIIMEIYMIIMVILLEDQVKDLLFQLILIEMILIKNKLYKN